MVVQFSYKVSEISESNVPSPLFFTKLRQLWNDVTLNH